jgi:hypothetical protein
MTLEELIRFLPLASGLFLKCIIFGSFLMKQWLWLWT